MQFPFNSATEHLLQYRVLPMFSLPSGVPTWQGGGELSTQSVVYYFRIDSTDYLLVREAYHIGGTDKLQTLLIGNAVMPHKKVTLIPPKEGVRSYVHIGGNDTQSASQFTGDFSVFRITAS